MTLPSLLPVWASERVGCSALLGERNVWPLLWVACARVLADDHTAQIVCVDGANRFDAFGLARLGRAAGVDPRVWLDRILLSRVYSADQLVSVLYDKTVPYVQEHTPRLCVGMGLLESLYDEDIELQVARSCLRRTVRAIDALRVFTRVVLVESAFTDVAGERDDFLPALLTVADNIVRVDEEGRVYG